MAKHRTTDRVPSRRRGGQELPDDVQDRPEQNAGYDAVVHAGGAAASVPSEDEVPLTLDEDDEIETAPPGSDRDS